MRAQKLFEIVDLGPSETCLITDLSDIRWLTGFSGSHAWLVAHHEELFLLTYIDSLRHDDSNATM